jgi:hypothetical protein
MLNLQDPVHAAAAERLRAEPVIWLTTVSGSGQPQSTPVWFLWEGARPGVVSAPQTGGPAARARRVPARPGWWR